ncbi:glycoside hydrolase family 97 protein [Belliella sp. DSM 107340]|uniref:Glycoside hydrolase family 97 protein n=1 Tax=Belliella calami TaxID=2923436 RepID=A0ABS9UJ74_9BACT|nr:glycoside hydrolase family 97 protein [Belliella calami]MCH7396627.1 glycoside hydrolase family 97 protein [Belliella calami]
MKRITKYRFGLITLLMLLNLFLIFDQSFAQRSSDAIFSPNGKIKVSLEEAMLAKDKKWILVLSYLDESRVENEVIPMIELGLKREDQEFGSGLNLLKVSKPKLIKEQYEAVHGKRLSRSNTAYEVVANFENAQKAKLDVVIRLYDDGLAFRYHFPEKNSGEFKVLDEFTSYHIPDSTMRWLQKFNPANEGYYRASKDGNTQADWAYPALFHTADTSAFFLIHEAGLDRNYCGTKLSNQGDSKSYKLVFPDDWNGRGQGQREPTISLPWSSPWRVIQVGDIGSIVASTLVDDLSPASILTDIEWIKPGLVSWNYWSHNHGTKDFQVVKKFADLAAEMNWPYTLIDWEWDAISNGGNLNDALTYIQNLGVKPLIWYNSGGNHTWVEATPKDRMLTHENRVKEFTMLKEKGVVGVKIDFFESEKQDMINYYIDILEDAAEFEMLIYFHGCLVPRGWARTYPHLMTYEGVRGAEWYNNGPDFTIEAPVHNTIMPFTRNVVGSMDYTPVTFSNSQFPHITSYGHEIALGVLFESALQHLADRPEGYEMIPYAAKVFLRDIPTIWDDTQFISGYPGVDINLARRSEDQWYLSGIHSESKPKRINLSLDFLDEGQKYKLTLIKDGNHDQELETSYKVVSKGEKISIRMLPRGGYLGKLEPIK